MAPVFLLLFHYGLSLLLPKATSAEESASPGQGILPYPLSHEATLIRKLQEKYQATGKVARPIHNSSKPILVRFGLRLIQMDIDEKTQSMKTSVWAKMEWVDENLRWNPREYHDLPRITLPWNDVWLPDISLVNTAETEEKQRDADIMVSFSGQMYWVPHRTYTSACLLDITNYPYDEHTCSMWFQSMAHYKEALNLTTVKGNPWDMATYLDSFKESQEWEILSYETERIETPRDLGMMVKFSRRPTLRFTLTVRRRPGYTGHLLMLPCVFLACMTVIVFCLPPERPDRNSLAMSLFGSFMVLLLILVEVCPPTAASIPKLGVYYAFNMTLVMVAVFLSGTVIHISRLGDNRNPVPKVVKILFIDVLSRTLLMHDRVSRIFHGGPFIKMRHPRDEVKDATNIPSLYPSLLPHEATRQHLQLSGGTGDAEGSGGSSQLSNVMLQMDQRLDRVEKVVSRAMEDNATAIDHEQEVRRLRIQWRNISMVLDRFCILMYVGAIIISLIVLFPRPI